MARAVAHALDCLVTVVQRAGLAHLRVASWCGPLYRSNHARGRAYCERVIRYRIQHNRISADPSAIADLYAPKDLRTRPQHNSIADDRPRVLRVAEIELPGSQRHTLKDNGVCPDAPRPDHRALGVRQKQSRADWTTYCDLDAE